MNDKKIITQNEKNYIETLYLYCNIEDFAHNKENHPTTNYYNMMSYISDTMLHSAQYLSEAKGRSWYRLPNYRIGIMDYDKAKIANQFNCVIQYEFDHLFTLDKNLTSLDLPFDGSLTDYHIKRIDITKIAKHSEDYLTNYEFISPYRRNDRVNGTVYLGNRKSGNVFRMYNKTRELLDTENDKKIELLTKYFGDIENLWTYELELSRSFLKNSLGIETLADLSKVYQAHKNIVGKIRFYENNDKNKKLVKQNVRERIKSLVLTDFVEYERVEKKRYSTSFDYAIKRMIAVADGYLDNMELEKTNEEYMKIFNELIRQRINFSNKDMVMSFEDTDLSHTMDEMAMKHNLMRANQSNELELEAIRAFKKIDNSHINSLVQDTICHQEEVRQKEASPLPGFSERV